MKKSISPALQKLIESKKIDFDINEDLSDLIELNELGWRIKDPLPSPAGEAVLDQPIELHGVTFWKPTLGLLMWQESFLSASIEQETVDHDVVLLYALAHRKSFKEKVLEVSHSKLIRKARRWARKRLRDATVSQVEHLLLTLFGHPDGAQDKPPEDDVLSSILHHIVTNYGGTDQFWLFEASLERVASIVERLGYSHLMEERSVRDAERRSGSPSAPNPKDPSIVALASFRKKVKELELKKSSSQKTEGVRYG